MSPGADWKPFEVSSEEYEKLCVALESLDPLTLIDQARFIWIKAKRAPEFDDISDYTEWGQAVTRKYGTEAQAEAKQNLARAKSDA